MTKRTAARTQLSEDWQPSTEDWAVAHKVLSLTGLSATAELDKFKDHHIAHGKLMHSWSRAFRYWCRRAPEFARQGQPRQAETPTKAPGGYFGDDRPYQPWRDGPKRH